jgi:hypothetical protein
MARRRGGRSRLRHICLTAEFRDLAQNLGIFHRPEGLDQAGGLWWIDAVILPSRARLGKCGVAPLPDRRKVVLVATATANSASTDILGYTEENYDRRTAAKSSVAKERRAVFGRSPDPLRENSQGNHWGIQIIVAALCAVRPPPG